MKGDDDPTGVCVCVCAIFSVVSRQALLCYFMSHTLTLFVFLLNLTLSPAPLHTKRLRWSHPPLSFCQTDVHTHTDTHVAFSNEARASQSTGKPSCAAGGLQTSKIRLT